MKHTTFKRCRPEEQGIASGSLLQFMEDIEVAKGRVHCLLLLRRGHLVFEYYRQPYTATHRRLLHSLSKALLSLALGMLWDEGRIQLDAPVAGYLPGYGGAACQATVEQLLYMASGHSSDTLGALYAAEDWVSAFFRQPTGLPGNEFVYNSGASYLLSVVFTQITGVTAKQYLQERLFRPMDIHDVWWDERDGASTGGWGAMMCPLDIAKIGQLLLQKGNWAGRQLISPQWVDAMTRSHIDTRKQHSQVDWQQGYGLHLWRCKQDSYRADGAFGQLCVVSPNREMILVAGCEDAYSQYLLDIYWKRVYLQTADTALIQVAGMAEALHNKASAMASRFDGWEDDRAKRQWLPGTARYHLEHKHGPPVGDEVVIDANTSSFRLSLQNREGIRQVFDAPFGRWGYGVMHNLLPVPSFIGLQQPWQNSKYAARARILKERAVEVELRYLETPHAYLFHCEFGANSLRIQITKSYADLIADIWQESYCGKKMVEMHWVEADHSRRVV